MTADILGRIRSRGHWRINIRPAVEEDVQALTNEECARLVASARVSLRGWDYPHYPHRRDNQESVNYLDDCVEAWVDWDTHLELWRMYSSSQFVHYRAVNEDWFDRERWGRTQPTVAGQPITSPVLGILTNLWLMVEIAEFASRLHAPNGLYASGAAVLNIQLRNGPQQATRQLWLDDERRIPLTSERHNGAPTLTFAATLEPSDLTDPKTLGRQIARHFFRKFGFSPPEEQIERDIEKLYSL